jgi:hypothetical protein
MKNINGTLETGIETGAEQLEAGMYYEKVFSPESVQVIFGNILGGESGTDVVGQRLEKLTFTDKNGQTLELKEHRLISRVLMYFAKYTEFGKVSELRSLKPDLLQQALSGAIPKRNKDLKAMYDSNGRLVGIASTIHGQISWGKVKEIVEQAVQEVTGAVVQPTDKEHPFKWTYELPVKNDNISGWVGVHAGNNIMQGKSGIKIFSRFRTERQESGGIKQPACLNWCGMWQFPERFFNINMKKLNSMIKILGVENVKNIELMQMHLRPDMDEFKAEVKLEIESMIKAMEKIVPVIETSIHSKLSKIEMTDILLAYQSKAKAYLPEYIMGQILDNVQDETVWGFSQAVSFVRTHGAFKFVNSSNKMFKGVEDRDMTWKLENIAGEVLSLTPTIIDIHKKHGDITLDFLVGAEKAAEIRKAVEERAKPIVEVPVQVPMMVEV